MRRNYLVIFLFLLSGTLNAQWNTDTLVRNPLCTSSYNQSYPKICRDGSRGYYMGWWHDDGSGNRKPRVQRVDSAGYVLWAANGIQVPGSFNLNNWLHAVVSDDSGGVLVGWHNQVSSSEEIRAQRIDENGLSLWGLNSVVLYGNISGQSSDYELFTSDNRGGIIATWLWSTGDIYCQHLDKYGNKPWGVTPVSISTGSNKNFGLISDGNGGIFSTYLVNSYMVAQHLDSVGNLLWGSGINLHRAPVTSALEEGGSMCLDGSGGVFIAFDTSLSGNRDVYCHHLDSNGTIISPAGGFPIASDVNSEYIFDITSDNQGGIFASYTLCLDPACSQETILAKRINSSGIQLWADTACSSFGFNKERVKIVSDGAGGFICSWLDYRTSNKPTLYSQRYDLNGGRLWQNWGYPVCAAVNLNQTFLVQQQMATADNGAGVVVWTDTRTAAINGENIYIARIDGTFPVGIEEYSENSLFEIVPNPSAGPIIITFRSIIEKGTIEIFNSLGQIIIAESIFHEGKKEINLKSISQGIYFVNVRDGEQYYCKKLLVQQN